MEQKKVGIWVRVSDPKQVVKESHIHHELHAKNFVESRKWKVAKVYRLEAMSGKSIMNYPQTKEMLNDIKNGLISCLVFSKIARLARNTKELIEIADYFNEYNADLISMDMTVDTSTAIGRHFYRTMGSMAQWEREMTVERIKSSIQARAQLGKQIGGQPPLGYIYVNKKLTINQEEISVIKLIFELFLENKRKRTTARELNNRGYRTRRGNFFTDATIRRVLTDPVYKGLHRMNYSAMVNGVRVIKPKEEWVFHEVEPIVSEEVWKQVNDIVIQQISSHTQVLNRKTYLFTGYIYCYCGSKMYTHNKTKNYFCDKRCGNKVNREDLEEVFQSQLHSYTVSQAEIQNYEINILNIIQQKEREYSRLLKTRDALEKKIQKLLDLHLEGQIPTKSFKEHHDTPYKQLQEVKGHIQEIENEKTLLENQKSVVEETISDAINLYQSWSTLDHNQKRQVIETVVNKIIVGIQDISIQLYKVLPNDILPPFSKTTPNGLHNQ
ncbi:recombinase family protein [Mesoflavibacter zeaxanthinifaciens]|uniref:recombinase family protein n=1 Tax=Mesoflavibacter zeaxanthinifaciens TaxID=393060 RepID=UPI0004231017|nr:recombinase family protein [Mesoflavibacter zeaxanthinifaciens]